jgi:hypothetical protein
MLRRVYFHLKTERAKKMSVSWNEMYKESLHENQRTKEEKNYDLRRQGSPT